MNAIALRWIQYVSEVNTPPTVIYQHGIGTHLLWRQNDQRNVFYAYRHIKTIICICLVPGHSCHLLSSPAHTHHHKPNKYTPGSTYRNIMTPLSAIGYQISSRQYNSLHPHPHPHPHHGEMWMRLVISGTYNDVRPIQYQPIAWIIADLLFTRPIGTNCIRIYIDIKYSVQENRFRNAEYRRSCSGLHVIIAVRIAQLCLRKKIFHFYSRTLSYTPHHPPSSSMLGSAIEAWLIKF